MPETITREIDNPAVIIKSGLLTPQKFYPLAKVGMRVNCYEDMAVNQISTVIRETAGGELTERGEIMQKNGAKVARIEGIVAGKNTSLLIGMKASGEVVQGMTYNKKAAAVALKSGFLYIQRVREWEHKPLFEVVKNEIEQAKTIEITIQRKNGKTLLLFTASQEVENIYKNIMKLKQKQSKKWGMGFYELPARLKSEAYKKLCETHRVYDDYGSTPFKNGLLNIAFLRTAGGKGKVELPANLSLAEANIAVQNCVSFLREFFRMYALPYKATGTLTIEI